MTSKQRLETLGRHLNTEVSTKMAGAGSPLTTHVLDTARGCPAANLQISICKQADGSWHSLSGGVTNADGRCPNLLTKEQFTSGVYKITFQTEEYCRSINTKCFYPYVDIVFTIEDPGQHYHVPLILSPYGYSTYRGS